MRHFAHFLIIFFCFLSAVHAKADYPLAVPRYDWTIRPDYTDSTLVSSCTLTITNSSDAAVDSVHFVLYKDLNVDKIMAKDSIRPEFTILRLDCFAYPVLPRSIASLEPDTIRSKPFSP